MMNEVTFFGRSAIYASFSGGTLVDARVHVITPSGASKIAFLPAQNHAPWDKAVGGPCIYIINEGSDDLFVYDSLANYIGTAQAGYICECIQDGEGDTTGEHWHMVCHVKQEEITTTTTSAPTTTTTSAPTTTTSAPTTTTPTTTTTATTTTDTPTTSTVTSLSIGEFGLDIQAPALPHDDIEEGL